MCLCFYNIFFTNMNTEKSNSRIYLGYLVILLIIGIIDVVVGSIWDQCYLNNNNVNTYLILSGIFLMVTTILGIISIIITINKVGYESLNYTETSKYINTLLGVPALVYMGTLIWGMSIMWGTHVQNCNIYQYNYVYYRTTVVIFIMTIFMGSYMIVKCIGSCIGLFYSDF